MFERLYIIGNGFDLHHHLNTSYQNFCDMFAKRKPLLWKLLIQVYGEKYKTKNGGMNLKVIWGMLIIQLYSIATTGKLLVKLKSANC